MLTKLLTQILTGIQTTNQLLDGQQNHQRLWRIEDIGNYLQLKPSTVHSTTIKKPGFPVPIVLPSGGKRWIAKEVRAWATKQR